MPITLRCSSCGQKLKAKESLAGRILPCPKCGHKLQVPDAEDDAASFLAETPASSTSPAPAAKTVPDRNVDVPPAPPRKPATAAVANLPPLSANEPPLWLRHLHWLLILALLPLTLSLLQGVEKEESKGRLKETLDKATPEEQKRIVRIIEQLQGEHGDPETLFSAFPDQRLAGAFLPRKTWMHWGFAVASALLFMTFILLLASHDTANPRSILTMGLFTATAGIAVLLLFQLLANWSQGVWLTGGSVVVLIFYVIKLIGFSYQAAIDPGNGFFLSFIGYTFGVGFCEEVVKALPLLWYYRAPNGQSWRGAFIWGLASGAGFGIAEGVMYSANYYNGVSGPGIYAVRFISCVALHALWTGSVGITLNQHQKLVQEDISWYEYFFRLYAIVGVPMVLHGLYDTMLKKDMNTWALLVAVASFLFLAFQVSRLRGQDDVQANAAMLREYKRRRKLMA
jgi:RsiW-degrading membrane proteinase PrsW (M82 family)